MITSESKTSLSQGSNDVHHLGPVNRFVSERELGRGVVGCDRRSTRFITFLCMSRMEFHGVLSSCVVIFMTLKIFARVFLFV